MLLIIKKHAHGYPIFKEHSNFVQSPIDVSFNLNKEGRSGKRPAQGACRGCGVWRWPLGSAEFVSRKLQVQKNGTAPRLLVLSSISRRLKMMLVQVFLDVVDGLTRQVVLAGWIKIKILVNTCRQIARQKTASADTSNCLIGMSNSKKMRIVPCNFVTFNVLVE